MTPGTLLFIAQDGDRAALVNSVRRDRAHVVECFDAATKARRQASWERLLSVAHHGTANEVRVARIADIPGGVWAWTRHLAKLGALGIRLASLEEPWLTLDDGQARLVEFLSAAHARQRSDKIRQSLAAAQGKVGRPRVMVDVDAMARARETMSLRATAKAFGIGASTCHRILAAYREAQRSPSNGSRTAYSEGRE